MVLLNREQRREYEKKYGKEFSMQKYREAAYDVGFKKGFEESVYTTYMLVMNMVAYTLNYKLGLGSKRLPEIMTVIADNIDSYRTGQLDANDYEEIKKIVKNLGIILEIK